MLIRKLRRGMGLVLGAVLVASLVSIPPASAEPRDGEGTLLDKLYTTPGYHTTPGQSGKQNRWFTSCEPYSRTVRCKTLYWREYRANYAPSGPYAASMIYDPQWVFNNLTYLPMMTRKEWGSNPLAINGGWRDSAARLWKTECDTPKTGRGGCRTYIYTNGGYSTGPWYWTFNNMVLFKNG